MTKEEFTAEFRSLYSLSGLTLDGAAGLLKTGPLTITRWFEGISAPHEVGRASVINALRKVAK